MAIWTPEQENGNVAPAVSEGNVGQSAGAAKAAARREAKRQLAIREKQELERLGVFSRLSKDIQEDINFRTLPADERKKAAISGPRASFFNEVFGLSPKVGDTVTLRQVYDKCGEGFKTMQSFVGKWAKKGIEVKVTTKPGAINETTYQIVKIGG